MNAICLALAIIASASSASSSAVSLSSETSVPRTDIARTSVLTDLETDPGFRESDFPTLNSSSWTDDQKQKKTWQIITMTDGVKGFKETYLYFYHPDLSTPRYVYGNNMSTFDVVFRLTMATNDPSIQNPLDTFAHHYISLVNRSSDSKFFKFVCRDDFSFLNSISDKRIYEISELEILPTSKSESKAYTVGKRFTWNLIGSSKELKVDKLETVPLDPRYAYWRIPGINGQDFDIPYQDIFDFETSLKSQGKIDFMTYNSESRVVDTRRKFCQTDIFYVVFPLDATMGDLVGASVSYSDEVMLSYLGTTRLWDQTVANNLMNATAIAEKQMSITQNQNAKLRSGASGDYEAITSWSTSSSENKVSGWISWLTDRNAYFYGYADRFELPAIQKLSPLEGTNFATGLAQDSSSNPYALDGPTADYLSGKAASDQAAGTSEWILRFQVQNVDFFRTLSSVNDIDAHYWVERHNMHDVDVLSLTFRKDGIEYTVGVVSNSGEIITDVSVNPVINLFGFDWAWLLIAAAILAVLFVVWLVINYLFPKKRRLF